MAGGGQIEMTGDVTITGNVTVNGTVTSTQDVVADTISLRGHIHLDPQGGTTSPPIP